jgi:hypothetical protein
MCAGRSAVGVRDRRRFQESPPQPIDRADIRFRRARAHGDAHAGAAEVDARAGGDFAPLHQIVRQIRWENGDIERVAGLDPTLEIGSEFVIDQEPVAGRAFEVGGKVPENATRCRAAENRDLRRLR